MRRRMSTDNNSMRPRYPADDYFGVFRNLESVSRKNIDSFAELLEYTYENRKEVEKKDDLDK